tara:strand:- start:1816 stop:3417 length:1602 start_codon:yes stop_codon:yes gene_type:complete
MAVDTTLISGAYKANKPTAGDLAGVNTIANITKGLTDRVDMYVKVQDAKHKMRNAEYDAYAQSVLDNSDLVGSQYEGLYDELMAGKSDFASADEKTRALMGRNLAAMSDDYNDYKELREEVAINVDDYSPAFTNSDQGKMYLDILKGDGKKLVNKGGRIGIEVDGEWKSISSIKSDLDANKIDKGAIDSLEAFRIKEQDSTKPFNYDQTRITIMNSLVSKSSYNSLKNDEIIPGRIFRNDLAESLMNQKYSDLGITDEDFEGVEGVDASNGIDAEEAENIVRHLEADETEMKQVMADYYTRYIGNNTGTKPMGEDAKSKINESYGYTNQQAQDAQQKLKDEGYDIEIDGVWGPKSEEAWTDYTTEEGIDFNETNNPAVDQDGVYNPDAEQTSNEQSAGTYNYTSVSSLSVDASGGSANILENGKKITMKNVKTGNMFIPTVDVEGVRAKGSDIVIATSLGTNENFGQFVKRGGRYRWVADEKNMKLFNENASAKQKQAFNEFIQIVQTDPAYAEQLLKHIKSGSGNINAGTLK